MQLLFFTLAVIFSSIVTAESAFNKSKTQDVINIQKILCLGDSLTEGYGVPKHESYPSLLQSLLQNEGYKSVEVANGGISGSTTASSLRRLQWHLKGKKKPDIVILALGANDGLRGQDVKNSQENLEKTIELAQKNKIRILLAGMKMPPNYGNKYTKEFEAIFPKLAKKYNLPMIPFLLAGVATEKDLNLPDGIHPNGEGYKIVANTVLKYLKPLMENK